LTEVGPVTWPLRGVQIEISREGEAKFFFKKKIAQVIEIPTSQRLAVTFRIERDGDRIDLGVNVSFGCCLFGLGR
jgi:hypothetical protein